MLHLQKRRLITGRIQRLLIGLASLIALNTTVYWSIKQNVRTVSPRDSAGDAADVSDFPIRQKVISIEDNWGDNTNHERRWEVIDPIPDIDGREEEETRAKHPGGLLLREKGGENARKFAQPQNRSIKRKAAIQTTNRPNVRYITLKSLVQLEGKEAEQNKMAVIRKQTFSNNSNVKSKSELPRRQTVVNVHRSSVLERKKPPLKTTSSSHLKSINNLKPIDNPIIVVARATYQSLNLSRGLDRTLYAQRLPPVRGFPPPLLPSGRTPRNFPGAATKSAILSSTGNIRYYSKPPWFSNEDIQTMRLLSEQEIRESRLLPGTFGDERKVALFRAPERIFTDEDGAINNQRRYGDLGSFLEKCRSREACAMVLPSNHVHEVLAFHVDRILGFNRTLPSVARNLAPEELGGGLINSATNLAKGMIYPMTAFDANAHIVQDVLFWSRKKFRSCALKDQSANKLDCEGTTPEEISSLALFDFLLQVCVTGPNILQYARRLAKALTNQHACSMMFEVLRAQPNQHFRLASGILEYVWLRLVN